MCPDRHIVSDEGSFWCELEVAAKALTLTDDTQSALRLRRLVEAFIRENCKILDEPSAPADEPPPYGDTSRANVKIVRSRANRW